MTHTVQQDRDAARRLKLPSPTTWTVNEAQEARGCVGCTVRYERGIRMVHAIPGCPSHSGQGN